MDIGQGLSSFGNDIADAMGQYHKEHEAYNKAESVANALSRIGITESGDIVPTLGADGKPVKGVKPILDPKSVDLFKTRVGTDRAKAQGALEALSRIGIHEIDTQRKAQAAAGGAASPFVIHEGRRYLQNPHTGALKPDTAVPRDEMGRTVTQQEQSDVRINRIMQQRMAAQSKGFDTALKGLGFTSRNDLFDPALQEHGTFDQGAFVPVGKPKEGEVSPVTEDATHVRVGYVPPTTQTEKSGKIKVLDKGRAGVVIAKGDLSAYQDQAAALAGPEASQALEWLRKNPDNKLAPQVAQKFRALLAGSASKTVPVPSQSEINVDQSGESDNEDE